MRVCTSAMIPAQIPTSRRRSKLTGLTRPPSTFHGPSKTATAARRSAGYAVAMLKREMTSRRSENSSQNSAVQLSAVNAIVRCRAIRDCEWERRRVGGAPVKVVGLCEPAPGCLCNEVLT
jgi:hypothetical protein